MGDLPGGHAAGHRDHGGAELDRALVDAQPSGEQPVAVRVVHDAVGSRPRGASARAHIRAQSCRSARV